jgi:hypothetical membrane protein
MIFGVLQFAFLMLVAEFLYPGHSVSKNYISDLGVGPEPSRAIFASSIIIFGIRILIAAFLIWRGRRVKFFSVFLALAGIGSIGVGLFNKIDYTHLHTIFAFWAFGFGGIAVITSFGLCKPPFSYVHLPGSYELNCFSLP